MGAGESRSQTRRSSNHTRSGRWPPRPKWEAEGSGSRRGKHDRPQGLRRIPTPWRRELSRPLPPARASGETTTILSTTPWRPRPTPGLSPGRYRQDGRRSHGPAPRRASRDGGVPSALGVGRRPQAHRRPRTETSHHRYPRERQHPGLARRPARVSWRIETRRSRRTPYRRRIGSSGTDSRAPPREVGGLMSPRAKVRALGRDAAPPRRRVRSARPRRRSASRGRAAVGGCRRHRRWLRLRRLPPG